MSQEDLDEYEIGAIREAGRKGGAFLDALGQTDLAQLKSEEWFEFLRIIVVEFEQTMRHRIVNDEPPF